MRIYALLLMLCSTFCYGQVTAVIDGPSTAAKGNLIKLEATRSNGSQFEWLLINDDIPFYVTDGGKVLLTACGKDAELLFVLVSAGDVNGQLRVAIAKHKIQVGEVQPGPFPPPKPEPPKPEPDPGPIQPGTRTIAILYESQEMTPELSSLKVKLRTGVIGQYLIDKRHNLLILEDDMKDKTGQPSPIVKPWLEMIQGIDLPAIIIRAESVNLYKGSLGDSATAESVLNLIKQHGG